MEIHKKISDTTCKPDAEASQPCVKLKSGEGHSHIYLNRSGSDVWQRDAALVSTRTTLSGTVTDQLVAAM